MHTAIISALKAVLHRPTGLWNEKVKTDKKSNTTMKSWLPAETVYKIVVFSNTQKLESHVINILLRVVSIKQNCV